MADAYKTNIRYIKPLHWAPASTSLASPADGRVSLALVQVTQRCQLKAIGWINGSAVQDNIYVGLYNAVWDAANARFTAAGGSIKYTSPELTQVGTNVYQEHILTTNVVLEEGFYYMFIETEGTTTTYQRQANQDQSTGWVQFYTRSGGFGAPTDPCPAITATGSNVPAMTLRVIVDEDRTLKSS